MVATEQCLFKIILFYVKSAMKFDFLISDFYKIGGYSLLLSLLHAQYPEYRWQTADLLATLVQNNPFCQQATVDFPGLVDTLYKLLDEDEVDLVRIKALYAISCKKSRNGMF